MTTPTFMVGLIKEGLRKDVKPWGTPDDSFTSLINAYQWRGRIIRRTGYSLLGILNTGTALLPVYPNLPVMGLVNQNQFGVNLQNLIAFDTRNSYLFNTTTGVFEPLPSKMPVTWTGTDSNFFTYVNYAGALWVTNGVPGLNGVAISNITVVGPVLGLFTFTITTATSHGFTNIVGQMVSFININPGVTNPTFPLNGNTYTLTFISATQFSVQNSTTGVYTSGGTALNNQVQTAGQDGIRYYGNLQYGPSTFLASWANYNPPISPFVALAGALLIFPYRGYLVFLNTYESDGVSAAVNFGNRARWTQIGTPYYSSPQPGTPNLQTVDQLAARDDVFGRGGANDAPTQEVIVGAAFIRDILVVYFEKSTWRLRFVNNTQNPFVWERVNVELGSDCTYSTIAFDKGVMTIGRRGILISDGNDTIRFDEKIPDDVFDIRVINNGLKRVSGIRTFRTKLCYWTFPTGGNPNSTFPNLVLVYNYESKTWSFFDDCFTTFGYYYPSSSSSAPSDTWNSLTQPWSYYTEMSPVDAVSDTGFETVLAGNQQGFVFQLEQTGSQNDPSLFIQSITVGATTTITSPNHNLDDETWIQLSGITGTVDIYGNSLNGRNFKLANPSNQVNTFVLTGYDTIDAGNFSGTNFSYTTYKYILPGSVFIIVGALTFADSQYNGTLFSSTGLGTGTVDYVNGVISITFATPIVTTEIYINVVSYDPTQLVVPIQTKTAYTGGGLIAKLSNIDIITKIFNFMDKDKRARLSKIDFYVDKTDGGQFTCNVLGDSSNVPINTPLSDNPQSNVVLTSLNPYQVGIGDETIYRLYCDAIAQTIQLELTLSDPQMAVSAVNGSKIGILSMIFSMRQGGRLV